MPQPAAMSFATRAVVEYVQRHRPQDLPRLLEGLHEPLGVEAGGARALLCDDRAAIPPAVLVEMLRRTRQEILGEEDAAFRIGFEMVALHRWDLARGLFLRLLGSPRRAARLAPWLASRFSHLLTGLKTEDLKENGCRISLTFNPDVPLSRDICRLFRGGIAALPLGWGGESVDIHEESCAFLGQACCRFAISWRPFTWRDRLATWLRIMPSHRQRFLAQTLEEHARALGDLSSRLQRAEASYRAVVDAAADALVEILPDGMVRPLNPAALNMAGLPAETDKADLRHMIHPEDAPLLQERHRRRLAGENPPPRYRFRIRAVDGHYLLVEASFSLIQAQGPGPPSVLGILRDVSQEEALNRALEEERARFHRLVESSPFGLAIVDRQGRYLYLNQAFTDTFGYTLDDFQYGAQWARLAYPERELRQRAVATWKADLEAMGPGVLRPRTFTVTSKDGSRKDVLFRAVALPSGENVITYEDVTSRLASQRALSESEARLRTLVEGSPDAILLVDLDRRVLMANQEAKSLLGPNLAGRDLLQALPAPAAQPIQDLWEKALDQDKASLELELPAPSDGSSPAPLVLEATAVSLGAGLMHLSLRDIGDRRRLESQQREAARLAGVLELAGAAAHELNQPLMSLQGTVELMSLYRDPDNIHRLAVQAVGEIGRLAELVGSFGKIVRYETKEYLGGARIIDLARSVRPSAQDPDETG